MCTNTHVEPELKTSKFFWFWINFDNEENVCIKFSFDDKFVFGWASKYCFIDWDT